jgi:hypothetical protein
VEFTDDKGFVHRLNAKEAVARGMDLDRLCSYLELTASGRISDHPDRPKLMGIDRVRLIDYIQTINTKLKEEANA